MEYIPESFPKIIRGTLASDETQGSTRQWPEEANYKWEALEAPTTGSEFNHLSITSVNP